MNALTESRGDAAPHIHTRSVSFDGDPGEEMESMNPPKTNWVALSLLWAIIIVLVPAVFTLGVVYAVQNSAIAAGVVRMDHLEADLRDRRLETEHRRDVFEKALDKRFADQSEDIKSLTASVNTAISNTVHTDDKLTYIISRLPK